MNILEHPIYKDIYDLCQEIEKLPASEQQTKVVVMASYLERPVSKLIAALKRIADYPVHSEPVAGAMAMQDIASEVLFWRCGLITELESDESVSPCHKPKGHPGHHEGWCLGSIAIWS